MYTQITSKITYKDLPPKPKFTFRSLKKRVQEFHRQFVLAPDEEERADCFVLIVFLVSCDC